MKQEPKTRPVKKNGTGHGTGVVRAGARKSSAPPSAAGLAKAAKTKAAPATKPAPKATRPTATRAKPKPVIEIPPILLEGDEPSVPKTGGGPGSRYALGAVAPGISAPATPQELPESYGTQRLLLTARDPHWLYAHWDFTREQLRRYNTRSVHKHLVLRVYRDAIGGVPHRETHVHPESRSWFIHAGIGATKFVAALGYYRTEDQWVTISTSSPTVTPPDAMSDDLSVWFETLPVELQFEQLLALVKQAVKENVPLMEAIQQLRSAGFPGLPDARSAGTGVWTPTQEKALAQIVSMDAVRRVWMGSLEITELIRRQFLQELSSMSAAQIGQPWSGAVSSLSSPYGAGEQKPRSFWFNVNAELIIYGATEPDARVTIGGRHIRLRPDGTFSYRFSLPDGQYDLPAIATSADGFDTRSAELEFSRGTEYHGEVQAHPQDPSLKPPLVTSVA